jgi:pimeloyl-ACP methyl ester carboxylesterase
VVNSAHLQPLESDREHVSFNLTGVTVDVLGLRQRLAEKVREMDIEELEAMAGHLSLGLLQGLDVAAQPDFDTFLSAEREKLRRSRTLVLKTIVERYGAQPEQRIPHLQQLIQVEPYEFSGHLQLLTALATTGRTDDAQRQCRASCAHFRDIPGVDLVALERAAHSRPTRLSTVSEPTPIEQEIRFCSAADGVQIAYASVGNGLPVVKAANWLNHLEYDWESPVWRHVFQAMTGNYRLVRYDARGNGLSDWDTDDLSFDALVSDLEAVVDAVDIARFPLIGISQGCAVCVEYAVRHPDKVSKLLLIGGFARGWKKVDSEEFVEKNAMMLRLIELGWGDRRNTAFRQLFTSLFMPNAPKENQDWFNDLQRISTSPRNAARLMDTLGDIDVRHRLPQVKAPTLVMHARHDMRVPYSAGLELAGGIPQARFITLHSSNHLLPEDDPAWKRLQVEMNTFLAS